MTLTIRRFTFEVMYRTDRFGLSVFLSVPKVLPGVPGFEFFAGPLGVHLNRLEA